MRTEAIIFDLDGTAIDSPTQKLPSVKLVSVVKELQAKYFLCAATGRCWTFAKDNEPPRTKVLGFISY